MQSEEWIIATQRGLGTLITTPKLTDKDLSKPQFRFLHDIVMAVSRQTGFGSGLYSIDETYVTRLSAISAKVRFLKKIVSCVSFALNETIDVSVDSILAGIDAEKTNIFLQKLYLAATTTSHKSAECVDRVLTIDQLAGKVFHTSPTTAEIPEIEAGHLKEDAKSSREEFANQSANSSEPNKRRVSRSKASSFGRGSAQKSPKHGLAAISRSSKVDTALVGMSLARMSSWAAFSCGSLHEILFTLWKTYGHECPGLKRSSHNAGRALADAWLNSTSPDILCLWNTRTQFQIQTFFAYLEMSSIIDPSITPKHLMSIWDTISPDYHKHAPLIGELTEAADKACSAMADMGHSTDIRNRLVVIWAGDAQVKTYPISKNDLASQPRGNYSSLLEDAIDALHADLQHVEGEGQPTTTQALPSAPRSQPEYISRFHMVEPYSQDARECGVYHDTPDGFDDAVDACGWSPQPPWPPQQSSCNTVVRKRASDFIDSAGNMVSREESPRQKPKARKKLAAKAGVLDRRRQHRKPMKQVSNEMAVQTLTTSLVANHHIPFSLANGNGTVTPLASPTNKIVHAAATQTEKLKLPEDDFNQLLLYQRPEKTTGEVSTTYSDPKSEVDSLKYVRNSSIPKAQRAKVASFDLSASLENNFPARERARTDGGVRSQSEARDRSTTDSGLGNSGGSASKTFATSRSLSPAPNYQKFEAPASFYSPRSPTATPREAKEILDRASYRKIDPELFELPVSRLGVSGGTAPFFKLLLRAPANGQPKNYYIGKDLERAKCEIVFYEQMIDICGKPSEVACVPLLPYMFDYIGVVSVPETGSGETRDLLVFNNLRAGYNSLRMLDIKIGEVTASVHWQGKSKLGALSQKKIDDHTNSIKEGFRLEGFDGAPPVVEYMDPLHDFLLKTSHKSLDVMGVHNRAGLKKKAKRVMLQRMPASTMLMHLFDVHQIPVDLGNIAVHAQLCPIEIAEIMLHEMVNRLVHLSVACHSVQVPQKWVGSSVALGFESDWLPERTRPESDVRASCLVHIFDWGRSEINTKEKHALLSKSDQQDREKYWHRYVHAIDRLSWEAARSYWNRFGNSGGWGQITITVCNYNSQSSSDVIGRVDLPVEGANQTECKVALLDAKGKPLRGRDGPTELTYSKEFRQFPNGSRLQGSWRIGVISVNNLPTFKQILGSKRWEPFAVISAFSHDLSLCFQQQTCVAYQKLEAHWNEIFDLPIAVDSSALLEAFRDTGLDVAQGSLAELLSPDSDAGLEEWCRLITEHVTPEDISSFLQT